MPTTTLADPRKDFERARDVALKLHQQIEAQLHGLPETFSKGTEHELLKLLEARNNAMQSMGHTMLLWLIQGGKILMEDAPVLVPEPPAPAAPEPPPPVVQVVPDLPPVRTPVRRLISTPRPPTPSSPPADLSALKVMFGPSWTRDTTLTAIPPKAAGKFLALLNRMGAPPEIADTTAAEREADLLIQIAETQSDWPLFSKEDQCTLIRLLVCRARNAQRHLISNWKLNPMFSSLSAFSERERPGFIHGLSRSHEPKGSSWYADAQGWWDETRSLREPVVTPPVAAPPVVRPTPSAPEPPAEEPEDDRQDISLDWPFLAITSNKKAVIIGGDAREESRKRIEDAFCFFSLEWVACDGGKKDVNNIAKRIEKGSVEFVIILARFIGHHTTNVLVPACKTNGVPFVLVERGYGVNQIRVAAERYLANKLK